MNSSESRILIDFHLSDESRKHIVEQICKLEDWRNFDIRGINLIPRKNTVFTLTLEGTEVDKYKDIELIIEEQYLLYWSIGAYYNEYKTDEFEINAVGFINGTPYNIREMDDKCFSKIRVYDQERSFDRKHTVKKISVECSSGKYSRMPDNSLTSNEIFMKDWEEKQKKMNALFDSSG